VTEGMQFLVHASYLEIYNEDVRDLLGKDVKQKLDLKEHPDRGVYVSGKFSHTFLFIVLLKTLAPKPEACRIDRSLECSA